jgi:ribosomal protein S18 acetylase RimI-like enzyme
VSDGPGAPAPAHGHALTSRPATPEDEPFLRALFREMREPELAVLPFDDAQRAAFSDQQYDARAAHYRDAYPDARHWIVEHAGTRVGSIMQAQDATFMHLVMLELMPACQGRGWGTELVRRVQREAARRGAGVMLHVESASPARRFYERLGFTAANDDGVHCEMCWPP